MTTYHEDEEQRQEVRLPVTALFSLLILLITIYTLTNPGRFRIVDEVSLYAVTESLALRGEADTNTIAWTQFVNSPGEVLGAFGSDGQVFSKKGPGPAFLALPWYWLLHTLNSFGSVVGVSLGLLPGVLLWNGVVTAATALLVWLTARRLRYDDRVGLVLALLFGLCTIAWPYATHFFGEPLSSLALLVSFYSILTFSCSKNESHVKRGFRLPDWFWLVAAGSGAAIGLLTVTAHIFVIGLLFLFGLITILNAAGASTLFHKLRQSIASLILLGGPVCIALIILLAYNQMRFGNPLETGYHFERGEGFTTPILDGLWGLILSPYRGLFWHTPLFFLSLVALVPFWRRHPWEAGVISAMSVTLITLYSTWWMWWGGFAWGPRFLVPLTPFWVLILAPLVEESIFTKIVDIRGKSRLLSSIGFALIVIVVASSFFIQIFATTVNYVNYEIELRSLFPTDWANPLAFGPPAQELRDFWHSPIFGQWYLLQNDVWPNLDLAWIWRVTLNPSAEIQQFATEIRWEIVLAGGATLFLAIWLLTRLWNQRSLSNPWPIWCLSLLFLLFLCLWLRGVNQHPRLSETDRAFRDILSVICQEVDTSKPDGPIIYIAPTSYSVLMNWLPSICGQTPSPYGFAENSMEHVETQQVMNRLLEKESRIWFVTGRLSANSPTNTVERWLAEHAFLAAAEWIGDFRLLRYGTPARLNNAEEIPIKVNLTDESGANQIRLTSYRRPSFVQVNRVLPIELAFTVEQQSGAPLRWFVQLLNSAGTPVALLDTAPLDGYGKFDALPVAQPQIERVGLYLPAETALGSYRLIAGLYDPSAENQRLQSELGDDFVELGVVEIE
ncbi:MAG: hypothetical protein AAF702_38045 [Chloroflexota bacterium]